jgi:hypothetical protein
MSATGIAIDLRCAATTAARLSLHAGAAGVPWRTYGPFCSTRVRAILPGCPGGRAYPFHDCDILVTACGRLCLHRKKINISTVQAGQRLGIKEVDDGIKS